MRRRSESRGRAHEREQCGNGNEPPPTAGGGLMHELFLLLLTFPHLLDARSCTQVGGRSAGLLQPTGGSSLAGELEERRLVPRATVESVWAARVKTAAARRIRRIGHLSRQAFRKEAAPVRPRHGR